jgi:hypothetical protein
LGTTAHRVAISAKIPDGAIPSLATVTANPDLLGRLAPVNALLENMDSIAITNAIARMLKILATQSPVIAFAIGAGQVQLATKNAQLVITVNSAVKHARFV